MWTKQCLQFKLARYWFANTFIPFECCPPRRFKRTWNGLYQGKIGPSVSWIKFCSNQMPHIQSFEFALRLSELIGSGRSSVNHTRHLAEIYDSNLVTLLAKNQIGFCFMSIPSKASVVKFSNHGVDGQTFAILENHVKPQTTSVQPMRISACVCVFVCSKLPTRSRATWASASNWKLTTMPNDLGNAAHEKVQRWSNHWAGTVALLVTSRYGTMGLI